MDRSLCDCSDLELLEMLLYYAVPRMDTKDIAERLLDRSNNISGVLEAGRDDLLGVQGIGENAYILIKAADIISGMTISGSEGKIDLSEKSALYDYLCSLSRSAESECIYAVFLNCRMEVISNYSYNCSDEKPFIPSEAFDRDFVNGEKFCVCAYVRPDSDPTPSKADVTLAGEIASELNQHSVELREFLLIGNDKARSAMYCRIEDQ